LGIDASGRRSHGLTYLRIARTQQFTKKNDLCDSFPDVQVASRIFMITPMPYHLLSYYRFRMGA
jgi:hypothetical protein